MIRPFALACMVLSLAGCASRAMRSESAPAADLGFVASGGASGGLDLAWSGTDSTTKRAVDVAGTVQSARSLIRTASLTIEVDEVDVAAKAAEQLATEVGGYVESRQTSEETRGYLVLRVPALALDGALDRLAALGDVDHREVGATDVTGQLADLEARLTNDKALRDRLRALLERATDVKDVLAVEEQLTRLQTAIDTAEGTLKRMREQVALSQVTVRLERREILGPLGYLGYGLYWIGKKLFILSD